MNSSETNFPPNELTPTQIVRELDEYVIGQHEAKKIRCDRLRNRWRRQQVTGQPP